MKPLQDKVLVRLAHPKNESTLHLPDNYSGPTSIGEVVAVGTQSLDDAGKPIPFTVKPGDKVYFEPRTGEEVTIDGKKHKFLRESWILAIIE